MELPFETGNFYVYAHYKKTDGQLFYIGKGKDRRGYSRKGRSTYWHRVADKHGFETKILLDKVAEPHAFLQEILAIKEFRPVCNFTKGGQGLSGHKQTEETIAKRIKKGPEHYRWGKTITKELVTKMHAALKALNLPNNKASAVYCIETGKTWPTIQSCALELGVKPSTLSARLRGQSRNKTTIRRVKAVPN